MDDAERIRNLEKRVEYLEFLNKRLGPQQETEEDKRRWDAALSAIVKDVKEKTGSDLEVGEQIPPVDRSKRCMLSGKPETPDHREIQSDGMQKDYVVLCPQERAKGFVRPVRTKYRHLTCGVVTYMSLPLAETYARDPKFYNGTFCAGCRTHFPLDQFVWDGTDEKVGS